MRKQIKPIIKGYVKQLKKYHRFAKYNKINLIAQIFLLPHYLYCHRTVHCCAEEYFAYQFHRIKRSEREKYLLFYHQKYKYSLITRPRCAYSKIALSRFFSDLYGREIISLDECDVDTFTDFFRRQKTIMLKPDTGSLGKGIVTVRYESDLQAAQIYSSYAGKSYVCEEIIRQHPDMNKLNPNSVNTLRMLVFSYQCEPRLIATTLRSGKHNTLVDNLKTGGIGANVDIETGIVNTQAMDYKRNFYQAHPNTGCPYIGFQVPFWKEAVAMTLAAHKRACESGLFGWDIAITEQGPVLVETNYRPGPMSHQCIDGLPRCEEVVRTLRELDAKSE